MCWVFRNSNFSFSTEEEQRALLACSVGPPGCLHTTSAPLKHSTDVRTRESKGCLQLAEGKAGRRKSWEKEKPGTEGAGITFLTSLSQHSCSTRLQVAAGAALGHSTGSRGIFSYSSTRVTGLGSVRLRHEWCP